MKTKNTEQRRKESVCHRKPLRLLVVLVLMLMLKLALALVLVLMLKLVLVSVLMASLAPIKPSLISVLTPV
jgi:hypothetical protein